MTERVSPDLGHGYAPAVAAPAVVPAPRATQTSVAIVTCAQLPELDPDDQLLLEPLAQRGIAATVAVWDDPSVDWAGFDLVLLRNPWDYSTRRDAFVAWAQTVPALSNPADVVAWNTDKRYLRDLGEAGVPVVPTTWVGPGDTWTAPDAGSFVVKPAVSAGSRDTGRYDCAVPTDLALAQAHVARLQAAGRLVMVQPYIGSVDVYGETGLLYFGGEFSHAIRKGPMLSGPDHGADRLFFAENITARQPTDAERAVANAALAAVPGGAQRLLYARVDLLDSGNGPVLIELELTEPSLFFGTAPGSVDRFADAVLANALLAASAPR